MYPLHTSHPSSSVYTKQNSNPIWYNNAAVEAVSLQYYINGGPANEVELNKCNTTGYYFAPINYWRSQEAQSLSNLWYTLPVAYSTPTGKILPKRHVFAWHPPYIDLHSLFFLNQCREPTTRLRGTMRSAAPPTAT